MIIVGSNMTEAHPVAATFVKDAVLAGAELIVIDPRRTDLVDFAKMHVPLKVGSDVALINGLMNVLALPYACGSAPGVVTLSAPDYCHEGNFGGVSMSAQGGIAAVVTAPLHTLDEIVGEAQVGLIKIDVEGFELEVLKGAKNLIARWQPAMFIENDRLEKSAALIQWLLDHGYQLYWHISAMYNPNNFRGNKENIFGNTGSVNMLCLHQSRKIVVEGASRITDANYHPMNALAPA